ncbi:MAG: hypothetical protein Q9M92_08370 [Enterobacterales bacterium]|nr:hypothetical protein [Enterobacterales bacterium]
MNQNRQIKKWLNIIIIVISALVLAFMLIGKLMERDKNQASQQSSIFFNRTNLMKDSDSSLKKLNLKNYHWSYKVIGS